MFWENSFLTHESCCAYLLNPVTKSPNILAKHMVEEQSLSLWHEGYFSLVVFEKQSFKKSFTCYTAQKVALPKKRVVTRAKCRECELSVIDGGGGGLSPTCLIKALSVSHCPSIEWQTFVYQAFVFPCLPTGSVPHFGNSKPLPLCPSFWCHISLNCLICPSVSFLLQGPFWMYLNWISSCLSVSCQLNSWTSQKTLKE